MQTRVRLAALLALALGAGAILASGAAASTVNLKNGRKIENCWILEEDKAKVVVAVIRNGNLGKIVLDPVDVASIEKTEMEPLELALQKERRRIEEEERKRAAERAIAVTGTAIGSVGPEKAKPAAGAEGGESKGQDIKKANYAELVGPLSPEEEKKVEELIQGIGDTRNTGGAGGRRERARRELVGLGSKAVEALVGALQDEVSYRRMNAAQALADIAKTDTRLPLYEEAIPKLIALLSDNQIWVRIAADRALQAISGQNMGFPEPQGEELTQEELAAIEKWGKWWDATKPMVGVR